MLTSYFCEKCSLNFTEAKLPNMNKRHGRCGSVARIVAYKDQEGDSEA